MKVLQDVLRVSKIILSGFKFVTSCVCQGVIMSRVCVQVSHLSAAPSQDGTSFDWFMFVMSHGFVKVSHLSAAPSRDGTSFDWFMFVMSHVFVKVSDLLATPGTLFNTHVIHYLEAVHRFYESRRRLFNDHQPSRRQKAGEVKKKCKKIVQQKKACLQYYNTLIIIP